MVKFKKGQKVVLKKELLNRLRIIRDTVGLEENIPFIAPFGFSGGMVEIVLNYRILTINTIKRRNDGRIVIKLKESGPYWDWSDLWFNPLDGGTVYKEEGIEYG